MQTLHALSTPDSGVAAYFADLDIVIAGSGLDEYFIGPEKAQAGVRWVTTLGIRWEPKVVLCWMQGDIASGTDLHRRPQDGSRCAGGGPVRGDRNLQAQDRWLDLGSIGAG